MSLFQTKDVYRIHVTDHPIFSRHWINVEAASHESFLTVEDLHENLFDKPELCMDMVYSYDLLGALGEWKVNKKSVSCKDIKGNHVRFPLTSKYRFWENQFSR